MQVRQVVPGKPDKSGKSELECVPLLKFIEYEPGTTNRGPEFEWECELLQRTPAAGGKSGQVLKLADQEYLPPGLLRQVKSGEDLLTIPEAIVTGDSIRIPPGQDIKLEKNPNKGDKDKTIDAGRRLLAETDIRTVLVVKVIIFDQACSSTAEELSDSVFGTDGDKVNLASQYDACSFGKLNFVPTPNRTAIVGNAADIVNGATEVDLSADTSLNDSDIVIRNRIASKLEVNFGVGHTYLADHLMYCYPKDAVNAIAYAYANSWMSTYKDQWTTYLTTQMHELGHNLDLGHSGEGKHFECS